jgi:electron transfer flavoprotein beta subunit
MGARKAEIKQITSKDVDADPARLGLDGSPTRVVKIFTPTPPEGGDVVEGTPEELAESIFQKLLECKVI